MRKVLSLIAITALAVSTPAEAKQCQTDFCHVSQVGAELRTQPYDKVKNNCKDFTYRAWELLEARGVTDLKAVTLLKGDLAHTVLEVSGRFVISAGEDGVRILDSSHYYPEWDEVYR